MGVKDITGKRVSHLDIAQDNKLTALFCKLDINMARMTLKMQNNSARKFATPHEVSQQFLADFRAQYPQADVAAYEKAWQPQQASSQAAAASQSQASAASSPARPNMELYEVSSAGETMTPLAQLREKGFDLGSDVTKMSDMEIWQITDVVCRDNVPTILLARGVQGESVRTGIVPFSEFVKTWTHGHQQKERKEHPGWPLHRTVLTKGARDIYDKGAVFKAVGLAAEQVEKFFLPANKLRILVKPTREVTTTTEVRLGELVMAPDTTKVIACAPKDAPPDLPEVLLNPNTSGMRFFLQPCTSDENVSPLWMIGKTAVEKDANMIWQTMKLTVTQGADYFGKVKVQPAVSPPDKEGKRKSQEAFGDATSQEVTVPILVNSKRLAADSVLSVYQAPVDKNKSREIKPISINALAKKMKVN